MTYDKSKEKPVEWVRVHNLPDFAYFNHSQHVVVAEEAIRKVQRIKAKRTSMFRLSRSGGYNGRDLSIFSTDHEMVYKLP